MTRETKIGLLVGLAFIIVIGILLSDHLTSSNEPPQATLAAAGNNVRSGVTTPGAGSGSVSATVVTPPPVAPSQTVPTAGDLQRPQPVQPTQSGQVQVAVGGPGAPVTHAPAVQVGTNDTGATQAPLAENHSNDVQNDVVTSEPPVISKAPTIAQPPVAEPTHPPVQATNENIASALREAARAHGEELVGIGGSNTTSTAGSNKTAVLAGTKQYTAVEGDSLSKIAAKTMGANTKANREAIINANPTLKQNADLIVAGRTYNIPGAGQTTTQSVPVTTVTTQAPHVIQAPAPAQPASNENWYTIKEGDTLTRIAQEQCGGSAAIPAILDLNKETLKDPNRVVINTKIKLPNKPLASATN
jgi:nucleoid-associated protein YgaU